jgi:hypothetical protein
MFPLTLLQREAMAIISRDGILRVRCILWATYGSSLSVEIQESKVAVELSAGDYEFLNIPGKVKQLPCFPVCHHEMDL